MLVPLPYTIIPLVYNITENILVTKPLLLQNGFKKAGLFPWDPSAPNMNRTKPSQIYTEDDSSTIEKKSTKLKKSSGLSLEQSSPADTQTLFNEQEIGAVLSGDSSPPSQEHRLDSTRMDKSLSCDNSEADNLPLPQNTQRFLTGVEHLLSEKELNSFLQLFAAQQYDVDNPPYQAWLLLKCATLPQAQENALNQVCIAICNKLEHLNNMIIKVLSSHKPSCVQKRKRSGGPKLPQGSARYNPTSDEFLEILAEHK